MSRLMRHAAIITGLMLLIAPHVQAATKAYPYQRCFEIASAMHAVPIDLLLAVAATESNWQADARSSANAHGVMQIQWPGTARHLGVRRVAELYNPCLNISLGAKYLAQLLSDFSNDKHKALAAYNYGPTRIAAGQPIPTVVQQYVSRVTQQQQAIKRGLVPERLQAQQDIRLTTFNSRTRARRIAKHLAPQLNGATVSVQRDGASRDYHVVLHVGNAGLTASDQIVLQSLGWSV